MVSFLPKEVSTRAIATYFIALGLVSLFFWNYAMSMMYVALGVIWVVGFFLLTSQWSQGWKSVSKEQYISSLVAIAFILRVIWVVISFYYYKRVTGVPFEIDAADSIGYHEEAEWLAASDWSVAWWYYFGPQALGISDVGYPLYLTALYKVFGPNIMIVRLIKAFLSAFTCYLLYKLASRLFGEGSGRMAGIMCALMPNFIIYCGYHLKETEMLFLEVAFLERMDYLLRSRKINVINIILPTLLAGILFFFRTVLGAAAIFAAATGVLLSSTPVMNQGWKRVALIGWGFLSLVVLSGGAAMTEIEGYWEEREENVVTKRSAQASKGSQWAKYATGSVMAPMVVVLPFSTMVTIENQQNQLTKHGGNYIRNFMGFFVFLAVFEAVKRKRWREFAMVGAFTIAYLGIISMSGFSNSERFLLPGLPGLILMWVYGISTLSKTSLKLLTPWCLVVFAMEFGWAFFKLGNRGLL
jgi:4-amino-4-deoxy-L-arabinose transferase-like glycosyltransferase